MEIRRRIKRHAILLCVITRYHIVNQEKINQFKKGKQGKGNLKHIQEIKRAKGMREGDSVHDEIREDALVAAA